MQERRQFQDYESRIESTHESDDKNPPIAISARSSPSKENDNNWWTDSGASQHMTSQERNYGLCHIQKSLQVKSADDRVLLAYGEGNLHLSVFRQHKANMILQDVIHVPKNQSTEKVSVFVLHDRKRCWSKIQRPILQSFHLWKALHYWAQAWRTVQAQFGAHQSCFGEWESNEKSNKKPLSLCHYRYGHFRYDNF